MALRMLEMFVPLAMKQAATELCAAAGTLGTWTETLEDEMVLVRTLAESEQLDSVIGYAEKSFGHAPGFRMVIFTADATLPRLVEKVVEPDPSGEPPAQNPQRIAIAELMENLSGGVRVTRTLVLTTVLSTIVATLGLMRNDATIVIGAMVIAPLLLPNMALSLATTLGDAALARRALNAAGLSLVIAAVVSFSIALVVPFDPEVPEIARRSHVDLSDIVLALASGSAGALALTTGLSGVLVGVMVAVALMPPLVVTVLLATSGLWADASQAALLVLTNVICVNLAGVATFLYQNVRPRHWWEASRATRMVRRAAVIWAALLLLLLALIYVSNAT